MGDHPLVAKMQQAMNGEDQQVLDLSVAIRHVGYALPATMDHIDLFALVDHVDLPIRLLAFTNREQTVKFANGLLAYADKVWPPGG
jgi:hypothetical protein